ncbi:hypothetical protein DICPUDRAFT_83754 [Dictyostelium purpureum]|uniref:Uncharacterized protein n=1 Tax=Dictyostelium purpureum TaxID=5786 RepID=F1A0I6_DICPU|nr:uncharacterized protein DICPUDRAFT_83754 [Dictyostelium purpureum]EGC30302.1 hypothetical protein DICPUDRAFT_83754 [Dictyostelium purpureum]|eukprot:XP_003293181.1 hypothetical protein DICPUDRAFT_83754 [Dictyostelium purpureum]
MIDAHGTLAINEEGRVKLNISQQNADHKSFIEMKTKLTGKIKIDEKTNTISFLLKDVNSGIIRVMNIEQEKISPTNGWVVGMYEALCHAHINMKELPLTLTFEHDNYEIMKRLSKALKGRLSQNEITGNIKKSTKLKKSYKVTIDPPIEPPKLKPDRESDFYNKQYQDEKLNIWKHFIKEYDRITKEERENEDNEDDEDYEDNEDIEDYEDSKQR